MSEFDKFRASEEPPPNGPDPDFEAALANIKPRWVTDGFGIRGNAVQTQREQPLITRDPPKVTQIPQTITPSTPEGTTTAVSQLAGNVTSFPFQVLSSVDSDGDATWAVHVGYIGTVYTAATDYFRDMDTGEFSIYVKVHVTNDTLNNFRLTTASATIVSDNDPGVVADPELIVTWLDADTKVDGTFYLKVADMTGAIVGGKVVITEIIQVLKQNISTYVIAGDEVIILVALA